MSPAKTKLLGLLMCNKETRRK